MFWLVPHCSLSLQIEPPNSVFLNNEYYAIVHTRRQSSYLFYLYIYIYFFLTILSILILTFYAKPSRRICSIRDVLWSGAVAIERERFSITFDIVLFLFLTWDRA